METVKENKHRNEVMTFYFYVLIISVGIAVLQPLSSLAVLFIQAVANL